MSVNNPLAPLLADGRSLILDGALATELETRGCDLSDPLWSAKVLIENPELIYQVHLDYFNAGAQCAITASYQATPQGFLRRGLDEQQSLALIAKSVQLGATGASRLSGTAAAGRTAADCRFGWAVRRISCRRLGIPR
ncbi:Homocysteine S-methyltransferase [Serratia odorifera]|uniref:Homocysteine S-methyltransferase n=1 Tax=Serratia odorifera TaxID=618 RepID=A0A3S4DLG7_SEROD|nr:Homocysteine S-methyltransferase [Serratia odorifera]